LQRRFRDMKIYRTDKSPQIVRIRNLKFTFHRPKIQDMFPKGTRHVWAPEVS
jgi:hypothetical protein